MRLGPTKVRNLRNVTMRNVIWANRFLNEHIGSHLKHSVNTFILFIKYHKTGFITNSLNAMSFHLLQSVLRSCTMCLIVNHVVLVNYPYTSLESMKKHV